MMSLVKDYLFDGMTAGIAIIGLIGSIIRMDESRTACWSLVLLLVLRCICYRYQLDELAENSPRKGE